MQLSHSQEVRRERSESELLQGGQSVREVYSEVDAHCSLKCAKNLAAIRIHLSWRLVRDLAAREGEQGEESEALGE